MTPDPDLEPRSAPERQTRNSRAPWDPPPKPPKPGDRHRGAAKGGGKLDGADSYGGYDDDMGRGAD